VDEDEIFTNDSSYELRLSLKTELNKDTWKLGVMDYRHVISATQEVKAGRCRA
jgi:hypothetical protein